MQKSSGNLKDLDESYIGKHQRDSMMEKAFEMFRKRGYSYNQSRAMAAQVTADFLNEQRQRQVDAIDKDSTGVADRLAKDFIDNELGSK